MGNWFQFGVKESKSRTRPKPCCQKRPCRERFKVHEEQNYFRYYFCLGSNLLGRPARQAQHHIHINRRLGLRRPRRSFSKATRGSSAQNPGIGSNGQGRHHHEPALLSRAHLRTFPSLPHNGYAPRSLERSQYAIRQGHRG